MVFDWVTFGEPLSFWQMVLRIVAAVIFGAIIGVEREMKNRPAGMRTHVLVCLGAALIGLVEQQTIAHVVALGASQINVSVGRLTAQIVSGVGFLGAGTIIIADRRISGLTTAASLWCAACLGLAVGAGFTTMALVACLVVMAVLKMMQQIVHVNTYKRLEIQFIHRNETLKYIRDTFDQMEVKILDQDFHAENTQDGQNIYFSRGKYTGWTEYLYKRIYAVHARQNGIPGFDYDSFRAPEHQNRQDPERVKRINFIQQCPKRPGSLFNRNRTFLYMLVNPITVKSVHIRSHDMQENKEDRSAHHAYGLQLP